MTSIRHWLKCVQPKQIIMFVLPLIIVPLLLISMLPDNFMSQSAFASPDSSIYVRNAAGPAQYEGDSGSWLFARNKGEGPDGSPKSKVLTLKAKLTGGPRWGSFTTPKLTLKEITVKILALDLSVKVLVAGKIVTKWEELQWTERKEVWLEQPMRKKWVAVYFGDIEVDWAITDKTWNVEVPGSRNVITGLPYWEPTDDKRYYNIIEPPGGTEMWSKEVFPQDGELTLDFSALDNIIPAAPSGTITHKLFLDGFGIADGATIYLENLVLGDHEILIELHTIDGQIIPISMPITVVPPLELLYISSETKFDETKSFEFTVKNNLNTPTVVDLGIERIPPGWDVYLVDTKVSVPASGESTFEVMVRPTIDAFPQYSMNAIVTASSVTGGYHALANFDVEAVFPDHVQSYRVELDGKETLAFTVLKDTSLANFRFENGKIFFEAEQPMTGFGLIIPRSLLEGPVQAVGSGGYVLSSVEDLFLSGTHELFLGQTLESGTITISEKVLTEISPPGLEELTKEVEGLRSENAALNEDITALREEVVWLTGSEEVEGLRSENVALNEEIAVLSEEVEWLAADIEVLFSENAELGGSVWRNAIIGLLAGLLVGGGLTFAVMRRRKQSGGGP